MKRICLGNSTTVASVQRLCGTHEHITRPNRYTDDRLSDIESNFEEPSAGLER